jgi:glycopeptide antibiotics resistance protein/DNA-binding XRE family transcriptional regulator
METKKIALFIKTKRKEKGLTQEQLANELFVTEKAISRWETGRGTPDISLLIPLAKVLNVSVSEILSGEKKVKNKEEINEIIDYIEINKKGKYNMLFKLSIICYIISILTFLTYLRFDYNTNISINYFIRLIFVIVASIFIIIGNYIYSNNYIDKISDKKKSIKISNSIIFIYYSTLLFNMTIFARFTNIHSYNLIPFKSIYDIVTSNNMYFILINILGNLLVFMPIEYFMIELFNVVNFKKTLLINFLIVFICEIIQYIFKIGVFDVDDIILCFSGMMLFYFLYTKYKSKLKRK